MEVLCIQLFGLCKWEFINNGNFLQCREINYGADGMIRHDQEIKVEKTWTCFYSLQTQLLRVEKGASRNSLLNSAHWGGKLQRHHNNSHGHGVETQGALCKAKFCVCALVTV